MHGISTARLRWICTLAVLSSLLVLPGYFVGEEAILAVTSMEMRATGDWSRHWLFGTDQLHVVFANWLIVPLSNLFGWNHVLAVSRFIMIASTATAGATVYWLTQRLWGEKALALLAAATYLSFVDTLWYRGWLAYRDPLFAALVFGAIATLWVGAKERKPGWISLSALLIFCAFLTKGVTAYVFYASAGFVMLWRRDERRTLLTAGAIVPVVAAFGAAVVWMQWVMAGRLGGRLSKEILDKLQAGGIGDYALSLLIFPADAMLRLMPASLVILYFALRNWRAVAPLRSDERFVAMAAAALLCVLPYWLAPQSHIRYLAPALPLIAIAFAVVAVQCGGRCMKLLVAGMWLVVGVKFLLVAGAFPAYQAKVRGANYAEAAADIEKRVGTQPLYTTDVSASGLSVAAYIDMARMPDRPLLRFPPDGWTDGWVMQRSDDTGAGRKVRTYQLAGDQLHLYCRGSACNGFDAGRPQ
jgi:4-amino-4-deoxy-L-arabinose transferase-like glycosyltransferase